MDNIVIDQNKLNNESIRKLLSVELGQILINQIIKDVTKEFKQIIQHQGELNPDLDKLIL